MIDAHQHYWHPARGDYGWMSPENAVLYRPFGPKDLSGHLEAHGIEKTILVQAAPSLEETEYLLGIADATPSVAGIVGWINFEQPTHIFHLKRLAKHPKFKGVRPMIQDIPDDGWMLRNDLDWAFRALEDLDLTFDALGFPRHLENFIALRKRYPDLRFVIDHAMKPDIAHHSEVGFQSWADRMRELADLGCYCKLSGLVTEAGAGWQSGELARYGTEVLRIFGAERVMWGSDWPVCLMAAPYEAWRRASESLIEGLGERERAMVLGGSATEFYRL
jgi:L-fuconolactonase